MRQQKMEAQMDAAGPVAADPYVALPRPDSPEGWPLRFQSPDPGADGHMRHVELGPQSVVLRRRVAGVPMKAARPLKAYQGLAVELLDPEGEGDGVAIVLAHADLALCVTLYSAPHIDDVVAEWRFWSAALGLPMLVSEADGTRRPAYAMIGRLTVGDTRERRARRGALKHRRPSVYRRRAAGRPIGEPAVHRGERELIARD
ncbi:DUF6101 family protein [Ancylobacter dichloromethanicus]|uniref:Uncharacterized protein n=1 Tax=Ancylobacter dichloromethanicus TaxID=518825 RepID=A0A9W6J9V9_9HYPH|nr:DUF6101 family protein [Ancylobacter dichloromethanicus]GLK71960.1 hypothetical protein GCM10017643_20760 [Ancylobacter dichloromethanicus]